MERGRSDVRWFLVFWLFVLSAVSYLDRVNISIAGSAISSEFHLSKVQLGSVFLAFSLGYTLFQTVGGWLADRLGPRLVLTAGVVWWGVFTALTAAVSSQIAFALFFFIAMRFLLGAGEAIIYPASNQFVSRWIPTQERGIANGLIFAGVGIGAGVTPILITSLMMRYGWRASFWMSALIGLAAGFAWYVIARDTPEDHRGVSAAELAHIQAGRTSKSGPGNRVEWSTIVGNAQVWAITVAYFSFGYVAWIFFYWFFNYLATVRGLDLKTSAFYTTLPFLAMAICSPLGGAISDQLTKVYGKRMGRGSIAFIGLTLTTVFLVLGSRAADARVASIVLAGGAGALYLSQSAFWAVSADISSGSSGAVSGFMNMGNQFGGMLTAQLTPLIALRWGWTVPFYVAAALAAVGAMAWLFVDPERVLATPDKLSAALEKA
jgi:ACS family glucarate transporter-like MFS transporter